MKKLLALITILCIVLSGFSVMAEPVEEDVSAQAIAEEPVVEEQDTVETEMTLKIGLDKSAHYTQLMKVPKDYYGMYEENKDAMIDAYQQENMTFDLYKEGEQGYIEVTNSIVPGSPINFSSNGNSAAGYTFAEDKGLFSTRYFITASYDTRTSAEEAEKGTTPTIATLTIKLPLGASYSNADEVSTFGTTHTWNIDSERKNPVNLVFTIPNFLSLAVLLAVILIAIVLVVLLIKRRNMPTDAELAEEAYNLLEGETEIDEFVNDPFEDYEDEEVVEEIAEETDENIQE
ncbi:MAG: hypothetical protein J6V58_03495 [Clostridia bacterium]|nr:hypothetical protein [Clostridia bacterium]